MTVKDIQFVRKNQFGIGLTVLFFFFHLLWLTNNGFWTDEFHTYEAARLPIKELVENRFSAGHLPTYFLLIRYWCLLVGFSEWSMRLPSLIFTTLSFFAFFLLCNKFLKDNFLFAFTILLFFFHPFVFWAGQEARVYSILMFLSIMSSCLILSFIISKRTIYLLFYSVTVLIGMSMHPVFILQVAVHIIFVFCHHRYTPLTPLKRGIFLKVFVSIVIPLLILLPLYLTFLVNQNKFSVDSEMEFIRVGKFLRKIGFISLGSPSGYYGNHKNLENIIEKIPIPFFAILLISSFIYLIAPSITLPLKGGEKGGGPNLTGSDDEKKVFLLKYAFYWMWIPIVLIYIIGTFFYEKIGSTRYYSPIIPSMILIMSIGFTNLKNVGNGLKPFLTFFKALFLILLLCILLFQMSWKGAGVRESIDYLKANYKAGDGIVFCREDGTKYAFLFYNIEYMSRIGIDKKLKDKEAIINKIMDFSKDKKRVWLFLYREERSPIPKLLEDYPQFFEKFCEKEIFEVTIKGFNRI